MKRPTRNAIATCLITLMLQACASIPSPEARTEHASALAQEQGLKPITLKAGQFELKGFSGVTTARAERLRVYIEGDGLAWITRSRPSPDPTPVDPLALRLALRDSSAQVIYLGRPCQYQPHANCPARYWLGSRFAPEVVNAYNEALNQLKEEYSANRLTLIGYSGGGAIATLLAEARTDVDRLVTIAGNLDTDYWSDYHRITPLVGSLNPADNRARLANVEQWHFVGEHDSIIPPAMTRRFVTGLNSLRPVHMTIIPGYDHHCCWTERWPALLDEMQDESP
ncbi:hypothetical protein ADIMK_2077 [Marinobacterium lacunae]|uniref:Alpha/beta hydrolase n=1 Tax=Marinobacterium lacunae TaxID=1232683 RepID=A0A081FZ20_9GAMM|nr:alpha/beta hydrolase [Marinobacterium lacunae]KEA63775.1 hypothetical protein ADIMK_2077 [Marinobacterium lacunae]